MNVCIHAMRGSVWILSVQIMKVQIIEVSKYTISTPFPPAMCAHTGHPHTHSAATINIGK